MKPDPAKLPTEALKLSPEERAALAASLLDSLGEPVDEDVEAAWAEGGCAHLSLRLGCGPRGVGCACVLAFGAPVSRQRPALHGP